MQTQTSDQACWEADLKSNSSGDAPYWIRKWTMTINSRKMRLMDMVQLEHGASWPGKPQQANKQSLMDDIHLAEKAAVTRIHVEMPERTSHVRFTPTCCMSHIIFFFKKKRVILMQRLNEKLLTSALWLTCGWWELFTIRIAEFCATRNRCDFLLLQRMLLSYLIKDLIRIALICLLFSIVEKRVRQLLQTCKELTIPTAL